MSVEAERVLAFEVGGVAWALPIADVREVADLGECRAIPTLSMTLASVTNHRGEALPVLNPTAILELSAERVPPALQLLVIGGSGDEPGRMGLPVDRVLGLAPAPHVRRSPEGVVRGRATLDGRMLRVLDAARLIALAEEAIARAPGRP